jgi:hypothetical protein
MRGTSGFTAKPILSHASVDIIDTAGFDYVVLQDLHCRVTGGTADALDLGATHSIFINRCVFEQTGGTGDLVKDARADTVFWDCEFKINGGSGRLIDGNTGLIWYDNCVFSGGDGTDMSSSEGVFTRCKFDGVEYLVSEKTHFGGCLFEPGADKNGVTIDVTGADMVCVRNTIFQDATTDGKYGLAADEANFSMLYGDHNLWYDNGTSGTSHRNNIDNYVGAGDVEDEDPNLDASDQPQAGSPAIGAGSANAVGGIGASTNTDIGRRQHTDAVGAVGAALSRVRIGM